jgi:hypothetical protein
MHAPFPWSPNRRGCPSSHVAAGGLKPAPPPRANIPMVSEPTRPPDHDNSVYHVNDGEILINRQTPVGGPHTRLHAIPKDSLETNARAP